ncbi:HNH endonuclease [Pseudomonas panipatensis]|uniref:HNH endonuclease n=1 Tax=Pseudomonas panipatensis TaxID=428992 RepID=UPI0035B3D7AE
MRPVRRGASPLATDYEDYRDAKPDLVSRLGPYCSFCERKISTQLAVEHIQPKGIAAYSHLIGNWENFLLACVNCNSTKKDKNVILANYYLPDRDNTLSTFTYLQNGQINPSPRLSQRKKAIANRTLKLVGLDKPIVSTLDENGVLIALDRKSQRMEAWLSADLAKQQIDNDPGNNSLKAMAIMLAQASGFFSIWLTVFDNDQDMKNRLVSAFPGTRQSGCFDPTTAALVLPSPNHDALIDGSKA